MLQNENGFILVTNKSKKEKRSVVSYREEIRKEYECSRKFKKNIINYYVSTYCVFATVGKVAG